MQNVGSEKSRLGSRSAWLYVRVVNESNTLFTVGLVRGDLLCRSSALFALQNELCLKERREQKSQEMHASIISLIFYSLTVAGVYANNARNEWDRFLWCPCFAPDKQGAQDAAKRIMSNYEGPRLSKVSDTCEMAEFVRSPDGHITWIYHRARLKSEKLVSLEITRAIDEAIRASSPFQTCGFIPNCTFVLMYEPKRNPSVWLGGSDHPSQFVAFVSKRDLRTWDRDPWAQANRQEIIKHLLIPNSLHTNVSAACGFASIQTDQSDQSVQYRLPQAPSRSIRGKSQWQKC